MRVEISQDAHNVVNSWVHAVGDNEIGGLFTCEKTEDGPIYVDEFFVLKQTVSLGSVDFEGEDLSRLIERLAGEGRLQNLRGSWHTHGDGDVFWSRTDEDAIRKYRDSNPDLPWLVSIVFNTLNELETRIDIFDSDAVEHITMKDITSVIVPDPTLAEKAKITVKDLVTEKKYTLNRYKRSGKKNNGTLVEAGKRGNPRNLPVDHLDDEIDKEFSDDNPTTTTRYKPLYEKKMNELTQDEWDDVMKGWD